MCLCVFLSENTLPYYKTLTKILIRKRRFTNLNTGFNILLCLNGLASILLEGVGPVMEISVLEES